MHPDFCTKIILIYARLAFFFRKGGGHGEEDIRKVAYFEQSIDPTLYKQVQRGIYYEELLGGKNLVVPLIGLFLLKNKGGKSAKQFCPPFPLQPLISGALLSVY